MQLPLEEALLPRHRGPTRHEGGRVTEPLRTAAQLAAHFGVKAGTILDWYEAGKIPPEAVVRLGRTPRGRLRFKLDVIEETWSTSCKLESVHRTSFLNASLRDATAIHPSIPI
jgi:hypothetical protein